MNRPFSKLKIVLKVFFVIIISLIGIGDNINSILSSPQKLYFVDVPPWLVIQAKNTTGDLGTISTVPLKQILNKVRFKRISGESCTNQF